MQIKLSGEVERFSGLGRKLGYPTANINVPPETEEGVFIGCVNLGGQDMPAMIFVGAPVTFDDPVKRAEAHILDFEDRDLYGEKVVFTIYEKIRDNQHFNSEQELVAAMDVDKQAVIEYFANSQ